MKKNANPIHSLDAKVVGQVKVAEESFLLSLEAPPIARAIRPGQFIQIRCTKRTGHIGTVPIMSPNDELRTPNIVGTVPFPLLPRPFSVYRVRKKRFLDILYEVVGRGTTFLSEAKKRDRLSIFGPLGNTFTYPKRRGVSYLVGGGVGLAPFYDLAESLIDPKQGNQKKENVIVLLGARTRKRVFCEEDFMGLGVRFEVATDDGSYGFKGVVTQLLEKHLPTTHNPQLTTHLYACGPKAMLRAVSKISERLKLPCEMSIDAHMPCGYGVCFGCAIKTRNQNYKLVCIDGPVFRAEELS